MTDEELGLDEMTEAHWYMLFAFFIALWMILLMVVF